MLQNGTLEPIAYSLVGQATNQIKVPSREPTPSNTASGTSHPDRSDVLKDMNNKKTEGNPSK